MKILLEDFDAKLETEDDLILRIGEKSLHGMGMIMVLQ
jgi:hypothetical protein